MRFPIPGTLSDCEDQPLTAGKAGRAPLPTPTTLPLLHRKGDETSPGRKVNRPAPSYMTFGILISIMSVGVAEGILRVYGERVKSRAALTSGQSLHEQAFPHYENYGSAAGARIR